MNYLIRFQNVSNNATNCSSIAGYLTIGISSVNRPNTDRIYLYETLDSIIGKIAEVEHHRVTIVILVSDSNMTYNTELSSTIYERYQSHCDDGLIHVIQASKCIYPDLEHVKRTYNDTQPRLKWRAKQNIDYAFLMLYCRDVSDFYMQLEDDVIAATDFLQDIQSKIKNTTQRWFLLEFSRLGFIGKLFHSADLEFAAKYLLQKYDSSPCDFLLGSMRIIRGQIMPIHSEYALFQHIGRLSSLKDKIQPAVEITFKDDIQLPVGDNTAAIIDTSLTTYDEHIPEHAYDNDTSTYFWSKSPMQYNYFTLIFEKPQHFCRIIIPTGAPGTRRDSFHHSDVMFSQFTKPQAFKATACLSSFVKLASLEDGYIDTKVTGTAIPDNIKYLRISTMSSLENWVIIRDIQLFVRHNNVS